MHSASFMRDVTARVKLFCTRKPGARLEPIYSKICLKYIQETCFFVAILPTLKNETYFLIFIFVRQTEINNVSSIL